MRFLVFVFLLSVLSFSAGCDMLKESADTTEGGGAGAMDVAEKSSSGTLEGVDLESGELPGEEDEDF